MKKEYSFDKKIIKVKITSGTVNIYRENISLPVLRYSDLFGVEEKKDKIKVTENHNLNTCSQDGITINSSSNCVVISSGSLTIVNGKIYSSPDVTILNNKVDTDDELEVALPLNSNDYEFDISMNSGNIYLNDVVLKSMDASIDSGDVTMDDVDIMDTRLKLMSGNIDLKIAESSDNYDTQIKVLSGTVNKSSVAGIYNESNNMPVKRLLKVSLMSGNVDLLFKGKE